MKPFYALLFVFIVMSAGCKGEPERPKNCGPESGAQASCWYEKGCWDLECEEINKNGVCFTTEGEAHMKKFCDEQDGVFYFGCTCPHENSIGGCQNGRQKDRLIITWLYGNNWDAEGYREYCESTAYDSYIAP